MKNLIFYVKCNIIVASIVSRIGENLMYERRIIDCHLHIGEDYFWKVEGNLDEYMENAWRIGITDSLVISMPCPVIKVNNYNISSIFAGIFGNKPDEWEMIHEIWNDYGDYSFIPPQQNPYQIANLITNRVVVERMNRGINLNFIPMVHPCLDTYEYWEFVANWYKPVAIKIHGLSSIFRPREIPEEFWSFIKEYKIPLIIHTDVYMGDEVGDLTNIYRNYNTPLEWLSVLQQNDVKAYLAHGARLCEASIRFINESSNFIVGLGPDSRLSTQPDQMYSTEPYLEKLFEMISIDKVCFDSDYPYNTLGDNDTVLEWESIDRIIALGLTERELAKVFYENASKFFNI